MDTQRIAHLIDLEKLPLDRLDSDDYAQVVAAAQAELDVDGCTVIKGFLRSEALPQLSKEIATIRPQLHESLIDINPYFSEGDPSLPHDHPVNTFIERSGGFIPRDAFNPTSDFEAVYQNPAFLSFLSDCLNVPEVHCFADPLAGLMGRQVLTDDDRVARDDTALGEAKYQRDHVKRHQAVERQVEH